MKRRIENLFNLPAEIQDAMIVESAIATPFRLTQADLDALKIKVAGFEFLNIPILACPVCGTQTQMTCAHAPDNEMLFFLTFKCGHYVNPKDKEVDPATTELSDSTQQPQQ